MAFNREQISKFWVRIRREYIRWHKRQTAKAERRAGKQLLDDAPKRRSWRGWTD